MSRVGIDTSFLVAVEARVHQQGFAPRDMLDRFGRDGELLAVHPDVLSEFMYVVTDPRRLSEPMSVEEALRSAEFWWSAKDVMQVLPTVASTVTVLSIDWMKKHHLGCRRIRDTMLAATYFSAGVTRIVTLNAKDFAVFGCFEVIEPPLAARPA